MFCYLDEQSLEIYLYARLGYISKNNVSSLLLCPVEGISNWILVTSSEPRSQWILKSQVTLYTAHLHVPYVKQLITCNTSITDESARSEAH